MILKDVPKVNKKNSGVKEMKITIQEDRFSQLIEAFLDGIFLDKDQNIEVVDKYVIIGPSLDKRYAAFTIEAVGGADFINTEIGIRPMN